MASSFQTFDENFPMEGEGSKENGEVASQDVDLQPAQPEPISTYFEEKIPIPESEQV